MPWRPLYRKIVTSKVWGIIRSVFYTLVVLAYPLLVYRGMDNGMVWLAPVIFSGLYLFRAYRTTDLRAKTIKVLIAAMLLSGAFFLQSLTAKMMPVFIQLLLMHFFGRTLLSGPPLIERFVRLEYPVLPAEAQCYARQWTLIWTVFFACNAVTCFVLAIWAPDFWWAVYNGFMIYTLTGLLMVTEYVYRHFRFPDWEIPSPLATLRTMATNGRQIWNSVYD